MSTAGDGGADSDGAGRRLAVVDLDGVVADVRHRLHHLRSRPKDWAAFFAAAVDDPVLEEGRAVVDRLAADHALLYLSGRPERCRADTEHWLRQHRMPEAPLRLRPEGDRRPARELKVELLRRLGQERPVAVLVDDDPEVCTAAERAGFTVFRADWMSEQPTLRRAQQSDGRT